MKDFDQERRQRHETDRRILIGGREFTYKASVAPEIVLRWNKAATGELGELTEEDWLKLFDDTTVALLDDGQEDSWREIRDPNGHDPLNLGDMRAVLTYLMEQATGRPTGEPSGSSPGSPTTATSSKDESS